MGAWQSNRPVPRPLLAPVDEVMEAFPGQSRFGAGPCAPDTLKSILELSIAPLGLWRVNLPTLPVRPASVTPPDKPTAKSPLNAESEKADGVCLLINPEPVRTPSG